MLFSKVLSLTAAIAAFGSTFSQAKLADGRYSIWNDNQSARSFPGSGHQGPFQKVITMSRWFVGIYDQWDIISDGNGEYTIRSAATGAKANAILNLNSQVLAASDEQRIWYIEEAGNEGHDVLYVIKVPNQDLLWTNTPIPGQENALYLKRANGSATQRFAFRVV